MGVRRKHHVGHTKQGVRACREDHQLFVVTLNAGDFGSRAPDPVALEFFRGFGPVQCFKGHPEFFCVGREFKTHWRVAAFY